MTKLKKIIAGTGIGAVVAAAVWLFRLNRASVSMEVVPAIKLHKFDLTGLYIRIDLQLKNPTRSTFKIKYPFVKLSYQGTSVGSSQVVNQDITLPPFGEAQISAIMVRIPILNIFSSAGKLLSAVKNNETIQMDVTTISTIDIGVQKIPYTKTDTLTLKK